MSDIFSEVEEDLRSDQMRSLWKRYGAYVVGLALGIVVVTAGTEYYEARTAKALEDNAKAYEAALNVADKGDSDAARAAFAAIAQKETGFAVMAELRRAGLLIEEGKTDEAAALFDGLANQSDGPAAIQALARIRATALLFDGLGDEEVIARLSPLAEEGAAYRHGALELLALSAVRAGDKDRARGYLNDLMLDPATPPNMRTRAIEVMGVIGDKQADAGASQAAESAEDGLVDDGADDGVAEETAQ